MAKERHEEWCDECKAWGLHRLSCSFVRLGSAYKRAGRLTQPLISKREVGRLLDRAAKKGGK